MANLDLINQYKEIKLKLNEQLKREGGEVAKQIFKSIFDGNPGLRYIVVTGWTPGFNDGEPCVHEQRITVGKFWTGRDGTKYYDFADHDDQEAFNFSVETDSHCNSECKTLERVEEEIEAFDDILQGIYETNFELRVSMTHEGEVVIDSNEYDCGY